MSINISENITNIIDEALFTERENATPRNYIGASGVSAMCQRSVQYDYLYPNEKKFTGRQLRVFERGHLAEDLMSGLFKKAGIGVATLDTDGKQFEFSQANGLLKGHVDGIIKKIPDRFKPSRFRNVAFIKMLFEDLKTQGFQAPCLWENKALEQKYFNQLKKKGLKEYSGTYYGQTQIYMGYFELTDNPALFTAIAPNTMDVYAELIPFNAVDAQAASDNAVTILQATLHSEILPRLSEKPDFWVCRMCGWKNKCFEKGNSTKGNSKS